MSARSYGSALSVGIVLIVLGIVFLIENFFAPFSAIRFIERYWPLVFIFVGLKKLVDFFLWSEPGPPNGSPQAKE